MVTTTDLTNFVYRQLAAGKDPKAMVTALIEYAQSRKLMALLPALLARLRFEETAEEYDNQCLVDTPFPLSSAMRQRIAQQLGISEINKIQEIISPDLLGGMRIRYQGTIIDMSADTYCSQLSRYLTTQLS